MDMICNGLFSEKDPMYQKRDQKVTFFTKLSEMGPNWKHALNRRKIMITLQVNQAERTRWRERQIEGNKGGIKSSAC